MKKFLLSLLLVAGILGLGLYWWSGNKPAASTIYSISLPDTAGQSYAFAQWKGRVTVINFWATWCPPCREEMPDLAAVYEAYKSKGIEVAGISTDELGKMREYILKHPVSYPVFAGDVQGMEIARQLGNQSSVLPYTVILDTDGTIVQTYAGRINRPALEKQLNQLIRH